MFALVSAIVVSIVGLLVGMRIADTVREQMIESYALSTSTQVSGTVNSFVTKEDLEQPLTGKKYDDFSEYVSRAMAGTNVVRVKLWRTDGTVLYSDDKAIVGKKFGDMHELEEAAEGEIVYEISDLKAAENVNERSQFNRLLEFYYPVYLDKENPDEVTAVYEVYMSVLPLDAYVRSVMRNLAIGLSLLVLMLIVIALAASRMLRMRNDKLSELTAELEVRADTDGLTGLHNHRHFQNYFRHELAVAQRYNQKLGLIMIDLDFFKNVNDQLGHQAGDQVLKKVAAAFETVLRDADYGARYGGEEFVAVLPKTDAEGALFVAERLREAVSNLEVDVDAGVKRPSVTLSCGVADYPACGEEPESLIAAADSALLFAKRRGRNRVCYFRDISAQKFEEGDLEKLVNRLQNASLPTIQALMAAVDSSEKYEHPGERNLAGFVRDLGAQLDLEENVTYALTLAAQVHEAGKIEIPKRGKAESLDESEVEAIRSHPDASAKIVESAAQMETVLAAVLHHHENWDGSGRPAGRKGKDIPYPARILRIIDTYESMVSGHTNNEAMASDEAISVLRSKAGQEFDPELVESFICTLIKDQLVEEESSAPNKELDRDPSPA